MLGGETASADVTPSMTEKPFRLSVRHGLFAVADSFVWFRRLIQVGVPMVPCGLTRDDSKVILE